VQFNTAGDIIVPVMKLGVLTVTMSQSILCLMTDSNERLTHRLKRLLAINSVLTGFRWKSNWVDGGLPAH
jgi:hypothetical protein